MKEYLVALGYKDNITAQLKSALGNADKEINGFASGTTAQFLKAGAAVTGFVITATVGIAKFLGGLAKSDLEMQKFARQMWTSEANARSLKTTLDAMGITLQDLWLSPELRKQFLELRQIGRTLIPPDEYRQQMKDIRAIGFEFTKLKLEFTYASQWIGYYLIKYIATPMASFKKHLEDLNKSIQVNMPKWTQKIAEVLSWFIRLGDVLWRVGETIFGVLDKIPGKSLAIMAVFATIGKTIMSGPFGIFILAISGFLLLLDDMFTYMDGGKSAFPEFWKALDDKGTLKDMADNIVKFGKAMGDIFLSVTQLIVKIVSSKAIMDGVVSFLEIVNDLLGWISDELTQISDMIKFFNDPAGLKKVINMMGNTTPAQLGAATSNPAAIQSSVWSSIMGRMTGTTPTVNYSPSYNISAGDPYATANAIRNSEDKNLSGLLRNLQGVTP